MDDKLFLCDTKFCHGPNLNKTSTTILYCNNFHSEIPLLALCNILSINGTFRLDNLKNGPTTCESVKWDRIQKFLLETLFKSTPPKINGKKCDTMSNERQINAIHSLYNSVYLRDNPDTTIKTPPNINYYLKQFIDLFETFSVELYYIPEDEVPLQFEIIQVQSDTTLLNLISSWLQKPSDQITINGKFLRDWTKLVGTVSFSHSSIEDFVRTHPENRLTAIYHENKFLIVTKMEGELYRMDIENENNNNVKVFWNQFNTGKKRTSTISRFDTIRFRSSIQRSGSFNGVALI